MADVIQVYTDGEGQETGRMEYMGDYVNPEYKTDYKSYVYIPANVTSDTPVTVYYTGDIGGARNGESYWDIDRLAQQGLDQIVIINDHGSRYIYGDTYIDGTFRNNEMIVQQIEQEYGVTLDQINTVGSSAGDKCALYTYAEMCREGRREGYCCLTGVSTINVVQNEGQPYHYGPNRAFIEDYSPLKGQTVFCFEGAGAALTGAFVTVFEAAGFAVVFAAASEAYERSNKMDAAIICDHIAARLFRASQWMMLFLLILIWIACA